MPLHSLTNVLDFPRALIVWRRSTKNDVKSSTGTVQGLSHDQHNYACSIHVHVGNSQSAQRISNGMGYLIRFTLLMLSQQGASVHSDILKSFAEEKK